MGTGILLGGCDIPGSGTYSGRDTIENQDGSEKSDLPKGKEQAEKKEPVSRNSGGKPGTTQCSQPRLAERITALRGQAIAHPKMPQNTRRILRNGERRYP